MDDRPKSDDVSDAGVGQGPSRRRRTGRGAGHPVRRPPVGPARRRRAAGGPGAARHHCPAPAATRSTRPPASCRSRTTTSPSPTRRPTRGGGSTCRRWRCPATSPASRSTRPSGTATTGGRRARRADVGAGARPPPDVGDDARPERERDHLADIARYQRRNAPIVVINTRTGKRHPFWSELDTHPDTTDAERLLILRPRSTSRRAPATSSPSAGCGGRTARSSRRGRPSPGSATAAGPLGCPTRPPRPGDRPWSGCSPTSPMPASPATICTSPGTSPSPASGT